MLSSEVTNERATLNQYNRLRADAYAASWLMPHQHVSGANMTVQIEPGRWIRQNKSQVVVGSRLTSSTLTAPSTNPRYDLLSINTSGALVVTAGSEAGSPSIPACPVGNLPIGVIFQRVGATSIKDADDSTNSYIIDMRPVMQEAGNANEFTNVQALSGTKNLAATDAQFQFLDPDGSNRDVNLPTTGSIRDGQVFNIINEGSEDLVVKDDGNTLVTLGESESGIFVYDLANTEWKVAYSTPPAPVQMAHSKLVYVSSGADSSSRGTSSTSEFVFDVHNFQIDANELDEGVVFFWTANVQMTNSGSGGLFAILPRLGGTVSNTSGLLLGYTQVPSASGSQDDIFLSGWIMGTAAPGASVLIRSAHNMTYRQITSTNVSSGSGSQNAATNSNLIFKICGSFGTSDSGNSAVLKNLIIEKKATTAFPI